ncbi:hypothetical protein BDZ97DRAFT_715192 [Flammula alnicola]|nr:hypothetical protein BDZ97DRAFT_715192 [Flammula alnicola]
MHDALHRSSPKVLRGTCADLALYVRHYLLIRIDIRIGLGTDVLALPYTLHICCGFRLQDCTWRERRDTSGRGRSTPSACKGCCRNAGGQSTSMRNMRRVRHGNADANPSPTPSLCPTASHPYLGPLPPPPPRRPLYHLRLRPRPRTKLAGKVRLEAQTKHKRTHRTTSRARVRVKPSSSSNPNRRTTTTRGFQCPRPHPRPPRVVRLR